MHIACQVPEAPVPPHAKAYISAQFPCSCENYQIVNFPEIGLTSAHFIMLTKFIQIYL